MEDKILAAYEQGITIDDICKMFNVTQREVINMVYGSKTNYKKKGMRWVT